MEETFFSFIISLAAGIVTPYFQLHADKDVDAKLADHFSEALNDWVNADETRRTRYPDDDYLSFLQEHIQGGEPVCSEIEELLILWQNRLFDDPACAAFITNFKLDKVGNKLDNVHDKLDKADERLVNVGDRLINVEKVVINIDKKIDSISHDTEEKYIQTHPDNSKDFRQKKDMSTLTVLMKAFDFDLLDNFCREYPYRVHIDVVNSCEAWSFIINRSAFHIFDENLRAVVMNFYTSWTEIIDFGWRYYSPNGHPDYYTFHGLKGDAFSNNELESVYNKMTEMRQHLYPKLKTMADYIQDNYPLDLDALALTFFKN